MKAGVVDVVRRLMRSSGFAEEEVFGGDANALYFASRDGGGDVPAPWLMRLAREKAEEIERAVPGSKALVRTVDEWVSIKVMLPSSAHPAKISAHATKKSPAQLQREIDEALARRAAFEKAKAEEAVIEKDMAEAQAAIDAFPRGPMGLTPDAVKAMPEWRAAKARVDKAFARLRAFNTVYVKRFAKELRAERAERTRARERGGQ